MMIYPFAWQMFKFALNLSGSGTKQNSFFVWLQSSGGMDGTEHHPGIVEKNRIVIRGNARNNGISAARASDVLPCFWDDQTAKARQRLKQMALKDRFDKVHGGWVALLGVVILSPDALLLRLIKADDFSTAFWRLGLLSVALLTVALWNGAKQGKGVVQSIRPGKFEMLTGLFYGGTCTLFMFSVRNTDAANTLIIIAATPLLAGLIGVFIFKRAQPIRTWVASVVVFTALLGLFSAGFGGENALGDMLALGAAICMACYFNMLGAKPEIDAIKGMLFGAFIASLVLLTGAEPLSPTGLDWLWLLVLGFWVLPVSFLMISYASRRIPAAEVSLIMLNEAIFGSFLVWVFVHEVPDEMTLISGTVVIATLVIHSLLGLRASKRARAVA
jgi:drug/metabolite transporter (DMT)-like permease